MQPCSQRVYDLIKEKQQVAMVGEGSWSKAGDWAKSVHDQLSVWGRDNVRVGHEAEELGFLGSEGGAGTKANGCTGLGCNGRANPFRSQKALKR